MKAPRTSTCIAFMIAVNLAVLWPVPTAPGIDLVQFHQIGKAVRKGQSPNIYANDVRENLAEESLGEAIGSESPSLVAALRYRREGFESYSTPFLYAVFANAPSDYERFLPTYRVCSRLALIVGLFGCGVAVDSPLLALCVGGFALIVFSPIDSDLRVANVNQLQVGMVGLLLLVRCGLKSLPAQEFISGVMIVVIVAFKPNAGVCLLLLTLRSCLGDKAATQRWRWLGAIAGLSSVVWFTRFCFPFEAWIWWIEAIQKLPDSIIRADMGNVSWLNFVGFGGLQIPLVVIAVTGLFGSLRHEVSDAGRNRDEAILLATGLLLGNLCGKLVWYHYLTLCLPGVVVVLQAMLGTDARKTRIVVTLLVAYSVILLGVLPLQGILFGDSIFFVFTAAVANGLLLAGCLWARSTKPNGSLPLEV